MDERYCPTCGNPMYLTTSSQQMYLERDRGRWMWSCLDGCHYWQWACPDKEPQPPLSVEIHPPISHNAGCKWDDLVGNPKLLNEKTSPPHVRIDAPTSHGYPKLIWKDGMLTLQDPTQQKELSELLHDFQSLH